ncbi:MAG: tRNA (guanosine(46)-N7)-methyltransferase TrmB [Sporomusaceae bacterium]|nr:tRNA (guanosine(46)-N7)-methyltransferase TrmB [Sporomusaceae bacterium]
MRLRKQAWIVEAIQEYSDLIVNLNESVSADNWNQIFGKSGEIYVEVGTGKGRFITEMAALHPDKLYVGVEAQHDIIYFAARKAREKGLKNVRFLLMDGKLLTELFAPGSIAGLFINFCDPWPKKRHSKRRLTHRSFFPVYSGLLQMGAPLCFKTDNRDLFAFSLNEFADCNLKLKHISLDLHKEEWDENVETEYEAKFSALGQPIYRCEVYFS